MSVALAQRGVSSMAARDGAPRGLSDDKKIGPGAVVCAGSEGALPSGLFDHRADDARPVVDVVGGLSGPRGHRGQDSLDPDLAALLDARSAPIFQDLMEAMHRTSEGEGAVEAANLSRDGAQGGRGGGRKVSRGGGGVNALGNWA